MSTVISECSQGMLGVRLISCLCFTGSGETDEAGYNTAGNGEEDSCVVVSSEEHLLTGHTGAVVCMAMHEDRLLFTGSTDCTIKVLATLPGWWYAAVCTQAAEE